MQLSEGRVFQGAGAASAKALRPEAAWCGEEMARWAWDWNRGSQEPCNVGTYRQQEQLWTLYPAPSRRALNWRAAGLGHNFESFSSKSEVVTPKKGFLGKRVRLWMDSFSTTTKTTILSPLLYQRPAYLQSVWFQLTYESSPHSQAFLFFLFFCSKPTHKSSRTGRVINKEMILLMFSTLATGKNLVLIQTVTLYL